MMGSIERVGLLVALLAAAPVAGCVALGPTPAPSAPAPSSSGGSPSASSVATLSPTALPTRASSCPPFEPDDPEPAAIAETGPTESMSPPAVAGDRMVLQGILLDWACNLRPDTTFSIWHIDARGYYGPGQVSGVGPECCWYAAAITTDSDARFELRSIRPGSKAEGGGESTPHIHAALETGPGSMDTTILFDGDEPLAGPPGPRQVHATQLERRTDEDGDYWWGFVVLRL